MRSILKKIAVRKKYKENMEAGVEPTHFRMAAYLFVNSANIIYGCLHTRIETMFCSLYLHSVIGRQRRRSYSMVGVTLGKGATIHCVCMYCLIQRMLAPLAAGVGYSVHIILWSRPNNIPSAQTDRQTTDTHTANKGLMWGRPGSDRARTSQHEP